METTARLDLAIWRNDDVYEFPLKIVGPNLSGVPLRVQLRLAPDTPGPALATLSTVTNGNAEGVRLAGVTSSGGVYSNDVRIRLNKSTRQALPYSGELGDAAVMFWAMQIAGRTRIQGEVRLLAHVMDSDAAPMSRPEGFGYGASAGGSPAGGAVLTISQDGGATLRIDGADVALGASEQAKVAQGAAEFAAATAQAAGRYFITRSAGEAGSAVNQLFSTDSAGSLVSYRRTASGSIEIARSVTPASLSASTGGDLVGFQTDGSGAIMRTARRKLLETVSVLDFGAVGDDIADDTLTIQKAIDEVTADGGGSLFLPKGTYRITRALNLRSGLEIYGDGPSSVIHLVPAVTRSDALHALGAQGQPLTSIRLRNFALLGDATFTGGTPSVINGGGFRSEWTDDCHCSGLWVSGFSDGGIAFLNGNTNRVDNCLVRYTGQGIAHNANAIDVVGNSIVNCTVTDTATYNGIHTEGSFGDDLGEGRVIGPTITGNTVLRSREAGVNIELSPSATVSGNTVRQSGYGGTEIDMGIKIYGSPTSTITGNTVTQSHGFGIICGANSSNSTIAGNTTAANGASLLVTDSARAGGPPIQANNDIMVGANNFSEGDFARAGNVSVRFGNAARGLPFVNQATPSNIHLDWYEEGVFTPAAAGRTQAGDGTYTDRTGRFTRIGDVMHFWLTIGWSAHTAAGQITITGLPYAPRGDLRHAATVIVNGIGLGGSAAAAYIAQGESRISLFRIASDTGGQSELGFASAVAAITISGSYRTAAGEA